METLSVIVELSSDDGLEHEYCEHVYEYLCDVILDNLEQSIENVLSNEQLDVRYACDIDVHFTDGRDNSAEVVYSAGAEQGGEDDENDEGTEQYIEDVLIDEAYTAAKGEIADTHCVECRPARKRSA